MTDTVVITGANRGIGLALVECYLARGCTVYGACRQSAPELRQSGAIVIEGVDVSGASGVAALKRALDSVAIDLLINNAGILSSDSLGSIDPDSVLRQFEVNALGPLMVTEALLGNLADGARIALITSRMGSVADNGSGAYYGYRMSKAALNMAGASLAKDLAQRGIAVALLHPGMVSTEMIGGQGDISAPEAAQRLVARIDSLSVANSGTFWHSNGEELPW